MSRNTGGPDVELPLTVAERVPVADDVLALTLVPAEGSALPRWDPGAHVDLVLGDDLVRQYSLCGDPADRTRWRIAVHRHPESRGGSLSVHDKLQVGDEVLVRGPRNNFPLVVAPAYLFVAGGIGITPILPMIGALGEGAEWRLVYGGRTRSSMAFVDRLVAAAGDRPDRLQVHPQDVGGLLDLDAALAAARPGAVVYCCGPEPLLAALEQRCAAAGRELHLERFTAAPQPATAVGGDFEVELASTGAVLRVPADRPILDVRHDAGVEVMSSCHEGVCGSCETPVLAGEIEHRDSILTPDEREAGDVMFVCVSRCRGGRLVLDL